MKFFQFRAPLDAMRHAATTAPSTVDPTSGMHSNLVDNAQPMGFTDKPDNNPVWHSFIDNSNEGNNIIRIFSKYFLSF